MEPRPSAGAYQRPDGCMATTPRRVHRLLSP